MPDHQSGGATRDGASGAPPGSGRVGARPIEQIPIGRAFGPFALGDEILADPEEPTRPIVIAGPELVHKIYDTRFLGDGQRARILVEAEQAIALSTVPGVVRTLRADRVDGWFVIEMERAGPSLQRHLDELSTHTPRPPAQRYLTWFAELARTLDLIHRRGVVHRDVTPSNLLFDRANEGLLVADFSVARTEGGTGTRAVLGTDRYVAPEQWDGEVTPRIDQYALGRSLDATLRSAGAPPVTAPVADVIARATAHAPDDRFESLARFAEALERACSEEAPRTLAERLAGVDPKWRYTWGPAAFSYLGWSAFQVLDRREGMLPFIETLSVPVVATAVTVTLLRATSWPRGRRSVSPHRLLDQVWLPGVVGLSLWALLGGLALRDVSTQLMWWCVLGSYFGFACVGTYPRTTGNWLIGLVDRLDRWTRRPSLRWMRSPAIIAVAILGVFVATAVAPILAQTVWPRTPPAAEPTPPAVAVVLDVRQALARGNLHGACAVTRAPDPCIEHGAELRTEHRRDHSRFAETPGRVDERGRELVEFLEPERGRVWALVLPGSRSAVGLASRVDTLGLRTAVLFTRGAPFRPADDPGDHWLYVVDETPSGHSVAAIALCKSESTGHRSCSRLVPPS